MRARRRLQIGVCVAASAASGVVCGAGAFAQPSVEQPTPRAIDADGPARAVSEIRFVYTRRAEGAPTVESLLESTVQLGLTGTGFVGLREGVPSVALRLADLPAQPIRAFHDSALPLIAPAVVQRLQALGLIGVYVEPDPAEIAVENGVIADKRPAGQTHLTLRVTVGVVADVRTIGLGERLPEDQVVNAPVHNRVRERSPVQPEGTRAGAPSLVRRDLIDDFVFWLNRHPGRRVDVAVAPTGAEAGAVSLDYLVTENRPWLLYGQVSNTGTEATDDWRERFGFVHNQLTNNDDIFSIDYLTGNFDDVHAVVGSYEAPVGDTGRTRWRVYGSWYAYTASDVGLPDADFDGDGWTAGGELIWNLHQDRDFFVDLIAGMRYERVSTDNEAAGLSGDEGFLIPGASLRFTRSRETDLLFVQAGVEGNASSLAGTDPDEIDALGRFDADDSWVVLKGDASYSFFVEPLLREDRFEPTQLAHEVALSVRGQYAFDYRLAPTAQDVVGGLYSVRGYPQSIVAGDSSVVATAEYRYHIARGLPPRAQAGEFFGSPFRFAPQYRSGPTDWDLILKAFVDIGRVVNSDRQDFETDQTLVGVGLGAELQLTRRVNVRVDWGFALEGLEEAGGEDLVDPGDQEVHFVLTLVF
ncbi:MAG TPA: hypothetical protein DEB06_07175 [Phycisphaerales bacterium]|nr:hypothetical protein [Phycisphaerales bacterium]